MRHAVSNDCGSAGHSRAGSPMPGWLAQALVVLRKDLSIELATAEVTTTSGVFSLLVIVIASLAFYGGPAQAKLVAAGVIWIAIAFAAVLALGRTWQREREEGALDGLLAAPLSRSAIFAGKALGLQLFLLAILMLVLPAAAVLFSLDLAESGAKLVTIGLLATPGVAANAVWRAYCSYPSTGPDHRCRAFPVALPHAAGGGSRHSRVVAGGQLLGAFRFHEADGSFRPRVYCRGPCHVRCAGRGLNHASRSWARLLTRKPIRGRAPVRLVLVHPTTPGS
jgi:hypothetical protein